MTKNKENTEVKKQIKVTQLKSPIGRSADQRQTLVGLGLKKIRKSSILEDTPSVRGMVKKSAI